MIRYRYIFALLMLSLCLSCNNDDYREVMNEYPIEVSLDCDMTKVGIEGNDLFWQSGDQIAFRAKGASGSTATTVLTLNEVDSGLPSAKFRGTVTMTEAPVSCEFAYPSTAFDDPTMTVFDYSSQDGTHKPYLYGSTDYNEAGMNCTLSHVGGLIRLKVSSGVESVSLSSNSGIYETQEDGSSLYNGQKISKVGLSADGLKATDDASHMINVSVPSGSGTVYVFMPAIEFVEGFSIVCNHSDGKKMFKSYSETGGSYSSYTFAEGSVHDIDLSEFNGFIADCTCVGSHVYDKDNILTHTSVHLTDFSISGSPAKIIDQWGVGIFDSDENFIRWVFGDGVFDGQSKEMTDQTGNWPLLLPGEYNVYAICNINGHTLMFPATEKLNIDHPKITVSPIAETSWSYKSNPDKANSCGNNTIERLGLRVNVSDNILNHTITDYGFKARMQNTTTGADTGEMSMNTNFSETTGLNLSYNPTTSEYELKNGENIFVLSDLSWGTHNVTALIIFAGKSYSASTSAYVTGLPYRHNFRAAEGLDGGIIIGSRTNWHKYNGYEIFKRYTELSPKYNNVFYSRTFALPGTASVKYSTSFFFVNTGLPQSQGTCTAYTGIVNDTQSPSTASSGNLTSEAFSNLDAIGSCAAKTEHVISGTGSFTSSSRVSASIGDRDLSIWVETGLYMGNLEILYN